MSLNGELDIFFKQLSEKINENANSVCVGFDPHQDGWPPYFKRLTESKGLHYVVDVWAEIILNICEDQVPVIKVQSAMFEALGERGLKIMKNLILRAKERGLLVILDAKRGDIGSTMRAYGQFAFDYLDADALTVVPYMGFDVLRALGPWLKEGKGVYVVLRSSNPAGARIQDMKSKSNQLFHQLILEEFDHLSSDRDGTKGTWGLVVGATAINSLSDDQKRGFSNFPLLLPGLGTQGATPQANQISSLSKNKNLLFPVSRSITGVGCDDLKWRSCQTVEDYQLLVASRINSFTQQLANLS